VAYERLRASLSAVFSPIANYTEPVKSERREQRFPVKLPVVVCGFGANGRIFSELTHTNDVSHSGCCVHLRTQPQPSGSLAIRLTRPEGAGDGEVVQVLLQVAWMRLENDGWTVGTNVLDCTDMRELVLPPRTPSR
jgi:hypothetical protein